MRIFRKALYLSQRSWYDNEGKKRRAVRMARIAQTLLEEAQ
jgi:hypothetical protein